MYPSLQGRNAGLHNIICAEPLTGELLIFYLPVSMSDLCMADSVMVV